MSDAVVRRLREQIAERDRAVLDAVNARLRLVAELKRRKVPVHYLILKDEGHGFSRNESVLAGWRITDRFLDRYLLGETAIDVDKP